MKRYQEIAKCVRIINAPHSLKENIEGAQHELIHLMDSAPSGSGFDNGTTIDKLSTANRLIFNTSFHHMNEDGYYIYWTSHRVIITPDLTHNFSIRITGKNKRDIKEYIGDEFDYWLNEEV
jgi:hypothetical protein